jgi:hypothetical protein
MADDPNLKTLWMGELPYWLEESYVYAMLQGALELQAVKVIRNKATNVSEGYGFIEFHSHAGAEAVLKNYCGQMIPGTEVPLKVTWAVGGGRRFEEGGRPRLCTRPLAAPQHQGAPLRPASRPCCRRLARPSPALAA